MMAKTATVLFVLTLLFATHAHADIVRSQLTSNIVEREPTNDLSNIVTGTPGNITTVYYFNHLTGMAGTTLTHKWLLNGEEKAVVNLNIGSNNWRTYSSKRMNVVMQGDWEVQVWHGETQLQSHRFQFNIEPRLR